MYEERIVVAELEVVQGKSTKAVYVQTTLLDNGTSGMILLLTDGEDVWKGQISEDDLDKLSSRLKMDFKKFVAESVSALTRERLQDITFEYNLKALPAGRVQLVWKKCVEEDDIKFQLGHVDLEKLASASQSLSGMLGQCVGVMTNLKKQIEELETTNERLARDRTNAIKRLDKCVAAKEELESDLFSKFVAILNSKKEKIRELEEEIQDQERVRDNSPPVAGSSRSNTSSHTNSPSSKNSQKRNGASSSTIRNSSPYAADTDEESDAPPPKQSKSSVTFDASINLGDSEEDEVTAPATRRPRRQTPAKKSSVSKPSLPKPSLPKVPSNPSIERIMPRIESKSKRVYSQSYTMMDVGNAVSGGMAQRKAARVFRVPRGTLFDYISGRSTLWKAKGRPQAIPDAIEKEIAASVLQAVDVALPLTRRLVLHTVGEVVSGLQLKTPFKDGKPGLNYWRGLKARNPELAISLQSRRRSKGHPHSCPPLPIEPQIETCIVKPIINAVNNNG